jgi:hypothetical protein
MHLFIEVDVDGSAHSWIVERYGAPPSNTRYGSPAPEALQYLKDSQRSRRQK